jgi:hypothetical protein
MELTRMDIILLILVGAISGIFYLFVGDKLPNIYCILIIVIFGSSVGIIKRFIDAKNNK